jgi:hypothetical protein
VLVAFTGQAEVLKTTALGAVVVTRAAPALVLNVLAGAVSVITVLTAPLVGDGVAAATVRAAAELEVAEPTMAAAATARVTPARVYRDVLRDFGAVM